MLAIFKVLHTEGLVVFVLRPLLQSGRQILLSRGQILEDVQFYVTVCRNKGWLVEAFTDEQEAIDWLRYTTPAQKPAPNKG